MDRGQGSDGGIGAARAAPKRKPLATITRRYDRLARVYSALEPLYLIFPPARRRAVAALGLAPGDVVLEIGAGTGRNLPYLLERVGPGGTVIALDAAAGMLAEARRLLERRGWSNVRLLQQDAAHLDVDRDLDGVLFSLSYSALPEPRAALGRAWERLRPGGRVVVMDAGLTQGGAFRLLAPIARLLIELAPGDAYSDPWSDLAEFGPVTTRRMLGGFVYVSSVVKA